MKIISIDTRNNCRSTAIIKISRMVTTSNFWFYFSIIKAKYLLKRYYQLYQQISNYLVIKSKLTKTYSFYIIFFMMNAERVRSYTSENFRKAIKMPQRTQELQQRKQKLARFHKESKMQQRFKNRLKNDDYGQLNKFNPDATQSTWRVTDTRQSGRGFSLRIKSSGFLHKKAIVASSINQQNYGGLYRSQTSSALNMIQTGRINSVVDIYPMQILNSMQRRKENSINSARAQLKKEFSENKGKRYLKKGTGVKQAIILNVLKSKINKTVAQSGSNYTGLKQNIQTARLMKGQIPQELRDVIGPEQMIRMANIFTGGNFGYQNLYQRVNSLINQRNCLKNIKKARQKTINNLQQGQTLKSKKIWAM